MASLATPRGGHRPPVINPPASECPRAAVLLKRLREAAVRVRAIEARLGLAAVEGRGL